MTGPRAARHPHSLSFLSPQSLSFKWCAYLAFGVRVGAVGQEELHRRHMDFHRSEMKGRPVKLRGGKEEDAARAMQ